MTYEKSPKISKFFYCDICDYKCCKQSDFNKHLITTKHINAYQNLHNDLHKNLQKKYKCNCGKEYKHRQSMYSHKKKCFQNSFENIQIIDNSSKNEMRMLTNLILEVVKSNADIVKSNNELQKQVLEISKDKTNTFINNCNNKTFNLNLFLNETCKDAMNITDFVESIKFQLSDLEKVGDIGYVEGISNIITTNLKALDITQRPIHCTDKKREIVYIKEADKWEKEDEERKRLRKAIKNVADKNSRLLMKFREKYPDCNKSESKYSDKYNKLIVEAFGGQGDNDVDKEEKIIKNITKNVLIEK